MNIECKICRHTCLSPRDVAASIVDTLEDPVNDGQYTLAGRILLEWWAMALIGYHAGCVHRVLGSVVFALLLRRAST